MNRADVTAELMTWLGTPYAHQQRTKGIGCDCGGLVGGVCVSLGLLPPDWWQTAFAEHDGYARTPANGMLEAICRKFMRPVPIDDAEAGDVVLIKFSAEPQHLAFLAPYRYGGLSLIHALSSAGKVVEHRYADVWRARATAAFVLPGL